MPVPSAITDLSTTPASNSPAGSETPSSIDDYLRTHAAFIKQAYDATQSGSTSWADTAGGTANALTLTPSPAITAYAAGQVFRFKSGASANTAATTVAISGLAAIAIEINGAACVGGEIQPNQYYEVLLSSPTKAQLRASFSYLQTDDTLRIVGSSDKTKRVAFEVDGLTTATTRTLTVQNKDGTIALIDDSASGPLAVGATVASNAMTLTLQPCALKFRSATLGSGVVNTRTVPAAISTVISSGSTGGTFSAQASRIILLAIDNAGTVELAWVNLAGGNNLDESTLISTTAEGGAGAADSASTIYSTTARSNVPFRVVGYFDSTQATAGTWASAPSTIQGSGGNAVTSFGSFGFGQTSQDLTGFRALGATYTNTTGKPMQISIFGTATAGAILRLFKAGIFIQNTQAYAAGANLFVTTVVLPGQTYGITNTAGTFTLSAWIEDR